LLFPVFPISHFEVRNLISVVRLAFSFIILTSSFILAASAFAADPPITGAGARPSTACSIAGTMKM